MKSAANKLHAMKDCDIAKLRLFYLDKIACLFHRFFGSLDSHLGKKLHGKFQTTFILVRQTEPPAERHRLVAKRVDSFLRFVVNHDMRGTSGLSAGNSFCV